MNPTQSSYGHCDECILLGFYNITSTNASGLKMSKEFEDPKIHTHKNKNKKKERKKKRKKKRSSSMEELKS